MVNNIASYDQFAKHLGAQVVELKEHYAKASLKIQKYFLNGVNTAHGGILFSLADYAFALAANTSGETGVAIQADIQFTKPAVEGDEIFAEIKIITRSQRLGTFAGTITNQKQEILAHFSAIAFFKSPIRSKG
ncbi:MAG TPA: hotdog fold thioesterase [Candidatus Omnitrophota bacterium]|nr:hotdog fold thioesterase [Candidatus Omnitrophota bacterium]HQL41459.1 hotdog fold thioesterase [Candidatus Omnitrophota bacterium]